MNITNRTIRTYLRYAHLFEGLLIVLYFYTPLGDNEVYRGVLQFLLLPLITVSGFSMWLTPRWTKLLRRG